MCLCGIGAVRTKEREEHPTIIQTIEMHQRPSVPMSISRSLMLELVVLIPWTVLPPALQ